MLDNLFEKTCFNVYKSLNPTMIKAIVPFVDIIRKINNKPSIPLKEKLAEIDFPDFSSDKVVLVHGVSVGEVLSLENLIKKIKNTFPEIKLVITTGTVTGQELAKKKYSEIADFITYFPLDAYKTVEKFLNSINPNVILIAETELWPNFSYCAKQKNIPLYIINGRISDKSYPSYLKIKGFLSIILDCYQGIFCQSELDRDRFIAIGAKEDKTIVMKNLKFEIDKKTCDIDLKQEGFKVLIAGSTHKGEDEIILEQYKKLKNKIQNLKLIIAPRHLTRLDEVKELTKNSGFSYGLRTKEDNFLNNDIIILDTLGELSKIYNIVDVAFIGGSFNKTGGHNPLEATIYSKPTISGPSVKNFRDIYSILEREAASFVVENEDEFYNALEKLFLDEEFYSKISDNCLKCFNNQQGASQFVIEKLKNVL